MVTALILAAAIAGAPTPAPVTFRVVPELLTGFVSTSQASTPYVGMRITLTRATADAAQQLRLEGSTHQGADVKDVRTWESVDLIASAYRYVWGDLGIVATGGSSIPLEGGRPVAAKSYPLLGGALFQYRPRDGSFRIAGGAGICQEAGAGLHGLASARIAGPGVGPAGSALVMDGCIGRTSLVRVNASVGIR
jgi:hypothetical protein